MEDINLAKKYQILWQRLNDATSTKDFQALQKNYWAMHWLLKNNKVEEELPTIKID